MRITREKHLAYITGLMPYLFLAYGLQVWLYLKLAPREVAIDVSLLMGVGLAILALCYALYDHYHQVILHRHHLIAGFDWPNYREEILYRNITSMEIKPNRHAFYNVTLHLRDGRSLTLYYLDDVEELKQLIRSSLSE